MSPRTLVIVNPASGGGATGRSWPTLRRGLSALSGPTEEVFTTRPGHATELARQAILDGFERLVVVGGDGTLNEAVNGLFEVDEEGEIAPRLLRDDIVLAPVRRGTGGDFARLLQLPGTGPRIFAHLSSDRRTRMDLGMCTYTDAEGRRRRRAFANVASFGLSGLVDAKINGSKKGLGAASFVLSIASALLEYRRAPVQIAVDGELLYEGPILVGVAANGAFFGGGVHIAPEARLDDGLLEIVILLEAGPREVMRVLDVYSGRHIRWPSARVARGRILEARVLDTTACLIDLDGEQPGRLDAAFEVLPGAVVLQGP